MFKKLAIAMLVVSCAGSAFAGTAGSTIDTVGVPTGIQGFNQSKNVDVAFGTAASGGTGTTNDVYGIATKHKQGDKIYATTSASSYIWFKNSASGTDLTAAMGPTIPNTPSDSVVSGGFSQM